MKTKVSEATDRQLDWLAAKCEWTDRPTISKSGCRVSVLVAAGTDPSDPALRFFYEPSTNWDQGGPIIEREHIHLRHRINEWAASKTKGPFVAFGPTPLIAAIRCYVASKLGDEVEIPEELK